MEYATYTWSISVSVGDIASSPSLNHLEFLCISLGMKIPNCAGVFYKRSGEDEVNLLLDG